MEKILLVVDAINPNNMALEFACYLAKITKSKVTAVFLENLVDEERSILQPAQLAEGITERINFPLDDYNKKVKLIGENIKRFKNACTNREVNFSLSRDRGLPLDELLKESRFADAMVIDPATTFTKRYEGAPSGFVKDVLSHSECPVIIAPESFEDIDDIVFLYDGSAASVFAIKQFAQIFPQFNTKKINIIQVTEYGVSQLSDKHLFNNWLQAHYSDLHIEVLKGKIETELLEYLLKRKNVFIVMGAYGRSGLSQLFKHSHADIVIKTVTQPIFIAHP